MKKVIKMLAAPDFTNHKVGAIALFPVNAELKPSGDADNRWYVDREGNSADIEILVESFPELQVITKPTEITITFDVKREEGYYWVRNKSKWQIALWSPCKWYLACNGIGFDDNNFDEINETKIERTT